MNKELIFIKDFYYTKSDNDIDVSEISPIMRRKLSRLDKHALTTMFKVYSKDAEEIVYASQDGESDRLNTIISQYTGMNEVSPAQFSASVHNYPAGFFTLFKKLNIPYCAVSAGKNSLTAGLIKAAISNYDNVLFTYADRLSVSCMVTKQEEKISFSLDEIDSEDEFASFINILEGKK